MLTFDRQNYVVKTYTFQDETVCFRLYPNVLYVEKPVLPAYQSMNVYVPNSYYEGRSINGYNIHTAPIFMPNTVGGYWPGEIDEPKENRFVPGTPNAVFRALQRGYVVAAPGIRGRTQKNSEGINIGKAPACILDYKAAVRFIRHFRKDFPGDTDKIITNGTSAGGALSSLMGTTGNHPDYLPMLQEMGAADESDEIFAASCYCPITNLDNADKAYEWQFAGHYDFHRRNVVRNEDGSRSFSYEDGMMSEDEIAVSKNLALQFPSYLNSLQLRGSKGEALRLEEDGTGSFRDFVAEMVRRSAEKELKKGTDLSDKSWLTIEDGKAAAVDFAAYISDITRMKPAPAFDHLDMKTPENDLFGTADTDCRHFTQYGKEHSTVGGDLADAFVLRVMNPMNYITDPAAQKAKHFRIRHGEIDRDTSLAISAVLTAKLREIGVPVDYHLEWGKIHSGDYDLDELFDWIDGICR